MGHVDHGKTSLLDALRSTDVALGESGGITQHIGAYQVELPNKQKITFLDTPGHEAFTAMRSRGAKATDIVILVVAADDGIMTQTIEAINHAKAANVPIIVAINKMDKVGADASRVKNELLSHEIVSEEFGGDVMMIEVSAKEKTNLDKLEEAVLLQAEILELKANPNREAYGVVIESKVEKGIGPVISLLVQKGTLKAGDIVVAGHVYGKIRAIKDSHNRNLKEALPSTPVEVIGINDTATAGDIFSVVATEKQARDICEYRLNKIKDMRTNIQRVSSLEEFIDKSATADLKYLPLIIKADVNGSAEAIIASLNKIPSNEIKVQILHSGVGGINESDITLGVASRAVVFGFNVRANNAAKELASKEKIEIRYYSIIYDLINDVKALVSGMMAPTLREEYLGQAEIRNVFNITKVGKVAGCYVTQGMIKRGAGVRLIREGVVIHTGKLKTLKRFKDEVKEVKDNFECGMAFENYDDIREKDVIEAFEIISEARGL
jgi:translation initiation factor IF-2